MEYFFSEAGYLQWFSIGLLLVLLELAVPGVYLIWFGFSAFIVGMCILLYPMTMMQQLIAFALISAVLATVGFFIYRKLTKRHPVAEEYKNLNNPAATYIGKTYNLAEEVLNGRSKINAGGSLWLVECPDDLHKGDRVKITAIKEGVILIGEKA